MDVQDAQKEFDEFVADLHDRVVAYVNTAGDLTNPSVAFSLQADVAEAIGTLITAARLKLQISVTDILEYAAAYTAKALATPSQTN